MFSMEADKSSDRTLFIHVPQGQLERINVATLPPNVAKLAMRKRWRSLANSQHDFETNSPV